MNAALSALQLRVWFLAQYQRDATSDCAVYVAKLCGSLDLELLTASINAVLARYEILSSRFPSTHGQPQWCPGPSLLHQPKLIDLANESSGRRSALLRQQFDAATTVAFDLANEAPITLQLVRCSSDEHYLIIVAHPIVADEATLQILLDDLIVRYRQGPAEAGLPTSAISYAQYAAQQTQWLSSADARAMLDFWRETLAAPLPILHLPTDRPRPPILTLACTDVRFSLPELAESDLPKRNLSADQRSLIFTLTAYAILLARYSSQSECVIGVLSDNRNDEHHARIVGPLATRLPLRVDFSGNPSARAMLERVHTAVAALREHDKVPIEAIIEALQLERDQSRAPIFQVVFAMHDVLPSRTLGDHLTLNEIPLHDQQSEYDLSLHLFKGSEQALHARLVYNKVLFDATSIERLVAQYQTLLQGLLANIDLPISELPLLPDSEVNQLLVGWNQTARAFPQDRCAHELFEDQVALTPEAVAIVSGTDSLSYAELNVRANQLAHHLQQCGVGPDVIVGICVERSLDLAIALLGVLKAGGAYLPLEPNHPRDRIEYMLGHAQPRLVLTQTRFVSLFNDQTTTFCLDQDAVTLTEEPVTNPVVTSRPENLVYVIYTSGSTGRPKGVAITQRGLTNYLCWAVEEYRVAEGNGSPVHSPLSFDLTVTSLWTPLLTGKKAVLLPDSEAEDALINCLRLEKNLSLIKLTPAHVVLLSQALTPAEISGTANALVIGGEALRGEMLSNWRTHSPQTRLINEYGPTETVVGCCIYEVPEGECPAGDILIGRPNANAQLYVLDQALNLTPIGVPGELYIGGTGLARGYLNRPDLSAERFIPNPFGAPGERLYKTGDLARYKPDGNLEYLGRVDHQVKVRGFRIELGEIEARLLEQSGVKEAVVIVREDLPGGKQLVAYVALADDTSVDMVRAHLRERLPDYMVPSLIIQLDTLPLNKNGKVERKALPRPDHAQANATEHADPENRVETVLCQLWEKLLHLPQISRNDNFFHRGGHSLLAVRLVGQIEQEFGIKLPLASVFQAPTIAELAALIQTRGWSSPFYSLVPIQPQGNRPPLFAIHTLYLLDMPKHLGTDQPLYFIRYGMADRVADKPVQLPTLEALAKHYIEEMRQVQADGPYYMMGSSFGGIVAFEMARQLHARGIEVGMVALLDTYLHTVRQRLPLSEIAAKIRQEGWLKFLASMLRKLGGKLSRSKYGADYWPHIYTATPEIALENAYRPQAYSGNIALFKAERGWDSFFYRYTSPEEQWRPLVQGELFIETVPGTHTGILEEPYVGTLVSALRAHMDSLQKTN